MPDTLIELEDMADSVLSKHDRPRREIKHIIKRVKILERYSELREVNTPQGESVEIIANELRESPDTVTYIIRVWQYL